MSVVVVGGGVVGAAATYQLARAGVAVTLVDAAHQGRATSAGAGILCPWSSSVEDPDWYRMAAGGADHYRDLRQCLADDGEPEFGYRRVGALRLVTEEEEAEAVLARVRARAAGSASAGDVELLDAAQARALFPPLGHSGSAVHVGGAARVDGALLRDALRRAAARRGAQVIEGTAALVAEGGALRGVRVGDQLIPAGTVIEASGAWAPDLLAPLGINSPIQPQRGQIIHLRLPGKDTSRWPVVLPMSSHYLLALDDSRVVVGATRETGSGFDYRLTAAGIREVLSEALAVAPGLADASYIEGRIGFRPAGPDIRPLLGTVEQVRGLILANGLGASGLTIGPYVGSLAALLAQDLDPGIDLAPFDPMRAVNSNP